VTARRLALLLPLVAVAALLYVMTDANWTNVRRDHTSTQTDAPAPSNDDGVWQVAAQIVVPDGASLQIHKHHVRIASFADDQPRVLAGNQRFPDPRGASLDRRPPGQIPLLI
jgi:hypothetical protein